MLQEITEKEKKKSETALVQTRGMETDQACTSCANNYGPFLSCAVTTPRDGCANCHFLGIGCSLRI